MCPGKVIPADAARLSKSFNGWLMLKSAYSGTHSFWPDKISFTDEPLFKIEYISNPKLVTDAYLLGSTAKHNAKLVSFDLTLPWHAIQNGSARLIETPLLQ